MCHISLDARYSSENPYVCIGVRLSRNARDCRQRRSDAQADDDAVKRDYGEEHLHTGHASAFRPFHLGT